MTTAEHISQLHAEINEIASQYDDFFSDDCKLSWLHKTILNSLLCRLEALQKEYF